MFTKKNCTIIFVLVFILFFTLTSSKDNKKTTSSFPNTTEPVPSSTSVSTITKTPIPNTPLPVFTPTPIHVFQNEVQNGFVFLEIPILNIKTKIDLATTIETSNGPEFIEPNENPLWIPNWSVEFGLPGLSMIYGHRQWGPLPKIFTDLNLLVFGDNANISTPNFKYFYTVSNTEVISPQDLWSTANKYNLQAKSENKNQLMLITCTPWGTNLQRLIVILNLEAINEVLP
jgi:LPXTG-site transpeptidase (sortase) family protein